MNKFQNDKVKVTYYGGVIEGIRAFADGYKYIAKSTGEIIPIERLDCLATETISYSESVLNSFELGRGYLGLNKESRQFMICSNLENDIIKVAYYGAVIESINAFVEGYKNIAQSNNGLISIEHLDCLANEMITHSESVLNSFELGRGYLQYNK